jgi:hypothetical protein
LGYFLAWFQSVQLPSTQSGKFSLSPLNPTCLVKYVLNFEQNCSLFIFRSGLTVTGLARVYFTYQIL